MQIREFSLNAKLLPREERSFNSFYYNGRPTQDLFELFLIFGSNERPLWSTNWTEAVQVRLCHFIWVKTKFLREGENSINRKISKNIFLRFLKQINAKIWLSDTKLKCGRWHFSKNSADVTVVCSLLLE